MSKAKRCPYFAFASCPSSRFGFSCLSYRLPPPYSLLAYSVSLSSSRLAPRLGFLVPFIVSASRSSSRCSFRLAIHPVSSGSSGSSGTARHTMSGEQGETAPVSNADTHGQGEKQNAKPRRTDGTARRDAKQDERRNARRDARDGTQNGTQGETASGKQNETAPTRKSDCVPRQ